jgi:hypothetical protein
MLGVELSWGRVKMMELVIYNFLSILILYAKESVNARDLYFFTQNLLR